MDGVTIGLLTFLGGCIAALIGGVLWWVQAQFAKQRDVNNDLNNQHVNGNKELNDKLAVNTEKVDDDMDKLEDKLILKLDTNSTHPNDFAHAQEIWQLNYDHTLELLQIQSKSNQDDHGNIIVEMTAMHDTIMKRMDDQAKTDAATSADFADKIERLALCVEALEKGEKC